MKIIAILLLLLITCLGSVFAAPVPEKVGTISDIPGLSLAVFEKNPQFHDLQACGCLSRRSMVAIRGQLSGTHLYGNRVIHSEENGA